MDVSVRLIGPNTKPRVNRFKRAKKLALKAEKLKKRRGKKRASKKDASELKFFNCGERGHFAHDHTEPNKVTFPPSS